MSYVKEAAHISVTNLIAAGGLEITETSESHLWEFQESLKIASGILSAVEDAYKNPKEDIFRNASSQRKAIQNYHHMFESEERIKLADAYLEASTYAYRKSQNEKFYAIIKAFRKEFPTIKVEDTLVNINAFARQIRDQIAAQSAVTTATTLIEEAKTEASQNEFLDAPQTEGTLNPEEIPEGSLDLQIELPTEEAPQEEAPEVTPEPKLSKKERKRLAALEALVA